MSGDAVVPCPKCRGARLLPGPGDSSVPCDGCHDALGLVPAPAFRVPLDRARHDAEGPTATFDAGEVLVALASSSRSPSVLRAYVDAYIRVRSFHVIDGRDDADVIAVAREYLADRATVTSVVTAIVRQQRAWSVDDG